MGLLFFLPDMDPTGREKVRCIDLESTQTRCPGCATSAPTKSSSNHLCLCLLSLKLRPVLPPGSIIKSHPISQLRRLWAGGQAGDLLGSLPTWRTPWVYAESATCCQAVLLKSGTTSHRQNRTATAQRNQIIRYVCRKRVWKSLNRRIMRLVFDLIDMRTYKILISRALERIWDVQKAWAEQKGLLRYHRWLI